MHFEIGDKILKDVRVVKPRLSKNFTAKYVGPYRILEVLSDRTVTIQVEGSSKNELIHVNRIKPLHETELRADEPLEDFEAPTNDTQLSQDVNVSVANDSRDTEPIASPSSETLATSRPIKLPPSNQDIQTPQVLNIQPRRLGLRSHELLEQLRSNRYSSEDYVLDSDDDSM